MVLEEWLPRIPDFRLDADGELTERGRPADALQRAAGVGRHRTESLRTPTARSPDARQRSQASGSCEQRHLAAVGQQRLVGASRYSGITVCHSSMATCSSARARCEPRQRCSLAPNAMWRFGLRSMITSLGFGNTRGSRHAGLVRDQHHLVLLHRAAVEVDVAGDLAGHADDRVGAQELLDRARGQRRVRDDAATVLGVGGEVVEAPAELALQRVEAADRQRHADVADLVVGHRPLAAELRLREQRDEVDVGVERVGSCRSAMASVQ